MSAADAAESTPDRLIDQVVGGKWRVLRLIGKGGMGAVYEGQNTSIGKRVALKFIYEDLARQRDVAARFQREAEAASVVESAHIVQVFDTGTSDDGAPYIVMELLRGEDLRARIRRLGRLPVAEAVHVVAQTLRGLHRAHEAGIVHRDLKPDNIFLVDRDDDPMFAKIVDFGISKFTRSAAEPGVSTLTRQGVVLGTPYYMSPEQAQAMPDLDARTDLWSVGAILYECLTGAPPHTGTSYESIIISICTRDADDVRKHDPSLGAPLAELVARSLARDRDRRFQSATEMLDALRAAAPTFVTARTPLGSASGAGVSFKSNPGEDVHPTSKTELDSGSAAAAPGPGTRVSWGTGAGADDEARARRGPPRTRVVAIGAAATVAAFVGTIGLLRAVGHADADRGAGIVSMPTASAALRPVESATPPDLGAAAIAAASAIAPPAVASSKSTAKKPTGTSAGTAGATTAAVATTPTAKPTSGIAGGLQIKTTYP